MSSGARPSERSARTASSALSASLAPPAAAGSYTASWKQAATRASAASRALITPSRSSSSKAPYISTTWRAVW